MRIEILNSGSDGNAYIITNENGNQILLECGLKYHKIANRLNLQKLQGVLISHCHTDHSLSKKDFSFHGFDIYDHDNLRDGEWEKIGDFEILPINVKHSVPNYGYIIKDNINEKKILFCTDLEFVPKNDNIDNEKFNAMLIECNYSKQMENEMWMQGKINNNGYLNHLSLEKLLEFLNSYKFKPKKLILCHTSNEGLLDRELALNECRKIVQDCQFAISNLILDI